MQNIILFFKVMKRDSLKPSISEAHNETGLPIIVSYKIQMTDNSPNFKIFVVFNQCNKECESSKVGNVCNHFTFNKK